MRRAREGRPREIVLIEDNPADVQLLQKAFERSPVACRLRSLADGPSGLDHVRRSVEMGDDIPPDLVLLDLNLPGMGGLDVLAELKGSPGTRHLPVVVISTSSDPEDVVDSYRLGAAAFVRKPFRFEGYRRMAASLARFWFETAEVASP